MGSRTDLELHVRNTEGGAKRNVKIDPECSVESLYEVVAKEEGVVADGIDLIHDEEVLPRDETPITDTTIRADSVVMLARNRIFYAREQLQKQGVAVRSCTLFQKISQSSVLDLLLTCGLDVNSRNREGDTLLHCAAEKGLLEIVQLLLERGATLEQSAGAGTPLHSAVLRGRVETAAFLLQQGLDVNSCANVEGLSPLHLAASRGDEITALFLMENGALLEPKNKIGSTPLHYAARGSVVLVHLLIEKGADVDPGNSWGLTPLHEAASCNQPDVADLLLDRGADIEARNCKGKTPLHCASEMLSTEIVTLLLRRGADGKALTLDKKTSLQVVGDMEFFRGCRGTAQDVSLITAALRSEEREPGRLCLCEIC